MTVREDRTDLPGALGAEYAADDAHRPLLGYAVLTAIFGAGLTGGLAVARRSGRPLPERLAVQDVLMAGIATHKVSRLITKDKIMSAVRAPFTRFQEKPGTARSRKPPAGAGCGMRPASCSSVRIAWRSGSPGPSRWGTCSPRG